MDEKKKESETLPILLNTGCITAARWNTHRPSKDDENLKGLAENIERNGMIHRIAVRTMPNGSFEVVDGHRRLEAAKLLGWTDVPCEVYTDMSDADAQARTLSANIQRLGNDPLLEAECIEKLADAGKTYEQIAAQLGTDARYVARRARLINLTDGWRKWLESVGADADLMERIAVHEQSLQNEVYEGLDIDEDGDVDEDMIDRAFERHMASIGPDTPFNTTPCTNCRFNTATHGFLFPCDEKSKGRCQCRTCFEGRWNAAVDSEIDKLRKRKVEVKQVAERWNVPDSWNSTPKRTKTNTIPYVCMNGTLKYLVWSRPDERVSSVPAMTEEEKTEMKRVRKAHAAWTKNRRAAYDKIRKGINGDEGKARTMAELIVATTAFTTRMTDEITLKLTVSYAQDCDCQTWLESLTDGDLAKVGIDALTSDERDAISAKDPAEKDNGEEA